MILYRVSASDIEGIAEFITIISGNTIMELIILCGILRRFEQTVLY